MKQTNGLIIFFKKIEIGKLGRKMDISKKAKILMQASILVKKPLWFDVVHQRFPPPQFVRQPKKQFIKIVDEEIYVRFFQRFPDAKLQDALVTGKKNPRMVYLKK